MSRSCSHRSRSRRPKRNGPNGLRRVCICGCNGEQAAGVLQRFYENLFATSLGVQELFRPGSMDKQKEMLNRAVELLLKFDPACGCPELPAARRFARDLSVDREHYDQFLDVLVRTMEQTGVADATESAAWRAAIDPAIEFMRTSRASPTDHRQRPDRGGGRCWGRRPEAPRPPPAARLCR